MSVESQDFLQSTRSTIVKIHRTKGHALFTRNVSFRLHGFEMLGVGGACANSLGQCVSRMCLREDFKSYFGVKVERAYGVAIMTDTDNAGGQATACYMLPVFR